MLLEHLYRISLERPQWWAMFIGLPPNTNQLLDIRIELLGSYIKGYREALRRSEADCAEAEGFFQWLMEKGEFPAEGWITKFLNDCVGNHVQAISKFWALLHEYLLIKMPHWLVSLNAKPLPSEIRNVLGTPKDIDIRLPSHIQAVRECEKTGR